ncbi:protein of unknown function [Paraburkholderia dioscoreae]|uniref:Uncharacterized protein n=1 Tax=Paraburkholderia dioscoreae TaxID=2604047 RepID=A0A5Q4YUW7_9BURK|nr:protein of unknown function [Paraburkholderia dioscoreae]
MVVDLMCHCRSGMPSAAATSSASMVLPVPGSPLISNGRLSVIAALTASLRSSVATYCDEPSKRMARCSFSGKKPSISQKTCWPETGSRKVSPAPLQGAAGAYTALAGGPDARPADPAGGHAG